jgi:hypothetical protein
LETLNRRRPFVWSKDEQRRMCSGGDKDDRRVVAVQVVVLHQEEKDRPATPAPSPSRSFHGQSQRSRPHEVSTANRSAVALTKFPRPIAAPSPSQSFHGKSPNTIQCRPKLFLTLAQRQSKLQGAQKKLNMSNQTNNQGDKNILRKFPF